jgi:hypothetical protein
MLIHEQMHFVVPLILRNAEVKERALWHKTLISNILAIRCVFSRCATYAAHMLYKFTSNINTLFNLGRGHPVVFKVQY